MVITKKLSWVLSSFLISTSILLMSFSLAKAKKDLMTPVKPDTLKTVNRICIGFIDGRLSDASELKENLQTQLVLSGFLLTPPCDATLVGSVQVIHSKAFYVKNVTSTDVDAVLLSPANEVIWAQHFSPLSGSRLNYKRGYTHNGLANRAMNIADALEQAKAKLLKASP